MSLAPAAADHLASRSRRACSIFVSAADTAPINASKSRARQPARNDDLVFMAPSSPESNEASMFFQSCAALARRRSVDLHFESVWHVELPFLGSLGGG